jgi:tetratricopeptide (TPR) repeat protein
MISHLINRLLRSATENKVVEVSPAVADLIRLCAFLNADEIQEEIFSTDTDALGDDLNSLASDPISLNSTFDEAARYSLIQRNLETRTLTMHSSVRAALKDAMTRVEKRVWAERAVRTVNKAFPEVEHLNWKLCSRLIGLVDPLTSLIDEYDLELVDAAKLMQKAGYYLTERGQYGEAERFTKLSLDYYERTVGAEDPAFATSLNNLAYLYNNQGRYAEAEPVLKRACVIGENALGADHPYLAVPLNNLAYLYKTQGMYAVAEPLYLRSLALKEQALGAEHQEVATALNNIALLYQSQEKYSEAEPLLKRALSIYEKALGAEHLNVLIAANNLACLYSKWGNYAEAKPLYERSRSLRKDKGLLQRNS